MLILTVPASPWPAATPRMRSAETSQEPHRLVPVHWGRGRAAWLPRLMVLPLQLFPGRLRLFRRPLTAARGTAIYT